MAKSPPRGGRGQPARAAAKSKKAAADVEVTEEAPGIGIEAGVAILTCLVLVGAILLVDKMQGMNGNGIFF